MKTKKRTWRCTQCKEKYGRSCVFPGVTRKCKFGTARMCPPCPLDLDGYFWHPVSSFRIIRGLVDFFRWLKGAKL